MLTYFPKFFSSRAIICYVLTLLLASMLFLSYAMPFQFMLFGVGYVVLFFVYSNRLTKGWNRLPVASFGKKLFITALIIRLVYVVLVYFYYIEMTGLPHAYHPGDELLYDGMAALWKEQGIDEFRNQMKQYIGFSDSGYCWWLAIEYKLLGTHVLPARILKCFFDAYTCVLLYKMAQRGFGEAAGRMAAIFYMLIPNAWFYCGVTLKETEMVFLTVLFVERADFVLRSPKIKITGIVIPALCILAMFTFRTALAAVMFASLAAGLIFTTSKQLQAWKKILYSAVFAIWMFMTVGVEIVQETQQLWAGRSTNQEVGMEWRANRVGGNQFAKYASASLFAPAIFTMPFSSMVEIPNQENQMMLNGANFVKNIMSGLTIFALFLLLLSGNWRKHVLPISLMCGYLVVLVFSNFAHAERFHFPVLGLELMFAAYGVTQLKNKHKRWFVIWLVVVFLIVVGWGWFKLAGRGMV